VKPGVVAMGRIAVGLTLAVSGFGKALEPAAFLSALHAYPAAAHLPATAIAALAPWLEVFLGFCLVAGVGARGAALWAGLLLLLYTIALVQRAVVAPHEGLWLFQSLDCGCGFGSVRVALKLAENAVLIALCAACVATDEQRLLLVRFD